MQLHLWAHRPTALLDMGRRLIGPAFRIDCTGRSPLVVAGRSTDVMDAFRRTGHEGGGADANDVLGSLVGRSSVLVARGAEHRTRRRELRAPLGRWGTDFGAELGELAERTVRHWPAGRSVALLRHCQGLMLDLLLHALLGTARTPVAASLRELLLHDLTRSRSARRWARPGPAPAPWPHLADHAARFDSALREAVANARPGYGIEGLASTVTGSLRDTLATVMITGHETAATALAWSVERVAHTPGVLSEIDRRIRARDRAGLERYLHLVVLEALRQRPVIPVFSRTLGAPYAVAGHELPPGTELGLAAWLVHHDPAVYLRPRAFRPERFDAIDGFSLPKDAAAWLPFGGGTRSCLGDRLAVSMARTALSAVLREYHVRPARAASEPPRRQSITIVPGRGCNVVLVPRRDRE
ncbi:cytochrome P450 [Streptomyces cellostaticus]|uniref:cytochrome P450 n=1 Tax=Streptomyces cellostaticus TaxID=67285 RepID=UPI002025D079|nr:cytochrome P450 [Streptomyces cellostaticus]